MESLLRAGDRRDTLILARFLLAHGSALNLRMLLRSRRDPAHSFAVAIPAIFVICISASSARATCGDYIQIGNSTSGHSASPMAHSEPHSAPSPGRPCHGPGCSQTPKFPATAPPTAVSPSVESWANLAASSRDLSAAKVRYRPDADNGRPFQRPNPIYRPPRS